MFKSFYFLIPGTVDREGGGSNLGLAVLTGCRVEVGNDAGTQSVHHYLSLVQPLEKQQ